MGSLHPAPHFRSRSLSGLPASFLSGRRVGQWLCIVTNLSALHDALLKALHPLVIIIKYGSVAIVRYSKGTTLISMCILRSVLLKEAN